MATGVELQAAAVTNEKKKKNIFICSLLTFILQGERSDRAGLPLSSLPLPLPFFLKVPPETVRICQY